MTATPVRQPLHKDEDYQEAMFHAAIDGKETLKRMIGDLCAEDSTEQIIEKLEQTLHKAKLVKKWEGVRGQHEGKARRSDMSVVQR